MEWIPSMNDLSNFDSCKNTVRACGTFLHMSGLEMSLMIFCIQEDQNYRFNYVFLLKEHLFGQGQRGTKKMGKISQNRPKNMFFPLRSSHGKTYIP